MIQQALDTPWKIWLEIWRKLAYPKVRLIFAVNGISWGRGWRFYGIPIIQKHRESIMKFGSNLKLRSSVRSNPLGPNHPIILCTWQAGADLLVGDNFGMTGGIICSANSITIGDRVSVGANTSIIDTDFHPLEFDQRFLHPQDAKTAPVVIEDDVFIGMNCLILKGVTIGRGSVVGAGSVVTKNIPRETISAGNPARTIGSVLSS
jgi:acetyltransferase-like isoleucine patch superfamily enzyme